MKVGIKTPIIPGEIQEIIDSLDDQTKAILLAGVLAGYGTNTSNLYADAVVFLFDQCQKAGIELKYK